MKIALGLEENSYSSQADRRFGRAPYFILGLKAVKNLVNLGVEEIIAGEIGPKAAVLIEEFKIPVYKLGDLKTVDEVIKNYKEKKLEKYDLSPKPQGLRMA